MKQATGHRYITELMAMRSGSLILQHTQKSGRLGGGQSVKDTILRPFLKFTGSPFPWKRFPNRCFLYIAGCSQSQGRYTATIVYRENRAKQNKTKQKGATNGKALVLGMLRTGCVYSNIFQKGLAPP